MLIVTLFVPWIADSLMPAAGAQEAEKAALVIQTGHTGPATAIAVSPDGRLVASGSLDATVKLWTRETGQQLRSFEGHSMPVVSVAFSPDSKTVASGSWDGTVRLWNVTTGELVRILPGKDRWIHTVAFSPDGATLASGTSTARIEIWNYRTGEQRFSIWQHRLAINALAFSRDGTMLASSSKDRTLRIWDPALGVQRREIGGQTQDITTLRFFPDGKTVACGDADGSIRTWNAESGEPLLTFDKAPSQIRSISVSQDGRSVAASSGKESLIRVWDATTGKQVKEIAVDGLQVNAVEFDGPGTIATANSDASVRVVSAETGTHIRSFVGHSPWVNSSTVSPDGKTAASGNADGTVRLWSLFGGGGVRVLKHDGDPNARSVGRVAFSPDAKRVASGNADGSVTIWNVDDGTLLKKLTGHTQLVSAIAFSPDGKQIVSGSWDKTARIWDFETGAQSALIDGEQGRLFSGSGLAGVFDLDFAPDGRMLAIVSGSKYITLWDPANGRLIKTIEARDDGVLALDFSPDGKTLATSSPRSFSITIWDIASGTVKRSIDLEKGNVIYSIDFSPDGRVLAAGGSGKSVMLYDEQNKEPVRRLEGHASTVQSVAFTHDGKFLLSGGGPDATMKLWPLDGDRPAVTMTAINREDWVATTANGLFDASPPARKLMHYVLGLEAVSLEQMKDTYFVPGLLRKVYRGDPLPRVQLFSSRDLFPDVEFDQLKPGQTVLPVKVTNRGGGIGQIQVLVNGKEIVYDARPVAFDPAAKQVTVNISLHNAPLVAGGGNRIEVIARNVAGSLSNKGTPRAKGFTAPAPGAPKETPNIYIIASGISHYTGEQLNLNFAAKDAEDFASAVAIGATRLLKGDKNKVRVRLLTSNGAKSSVKFDLPDAKVSTATKADFERAFGDFRGATSNDVFIVYLAGHGISLNLAQDPGRPGGNAYLYLTQEATTSDGNVLAVEDARKAMTISGDEIKEFMKQNKALKQVLILDTCAAGAASGSFVAKRDVPSDQIGALERLKDNTGFYILMGSASDRVSYETSQYAQGLLTYSLLQGMKGAMLREDQFADVEMLFAYSKNTVEQLARNIGGIQRPETITPDVSRSFDIGQFTAAERNQISLSSPIPLVLRPRLINPKLRFDNLGLEKIFRMELRAAGFVAGRGDTAKLVFVESDEMPDAILPSGDYTVDGENLTINLVLVRNGEAIGKGITVSGKTSEKELLIRRLVEQLAGAN